MRRDQQHAVVHFATCADVDGAPAPMATSDHMCKACGACTSAQHIAAACMEASDTLCVTTTLCAMATSPYLC